MNPRALMQAAMRREPTERIPTMPQIYYDMPVRLYAPEEGGDWIDGMKRCAENPAIIYDYLIRLVRQIGCDGLRMFIGPEPMKVARVGDELYGYILAAGDMVPSDASPANVQALADVATQSLWREPNHSER